MINQALIFITVCKDKKKSKHAPFSSTIFRGELLISLSIIYNVSFWISSILKNTQFCCSAIWKFWKVHNFIVPPFGNSEKYTILSFRKSAMPWRSLIKEEWSSEIQNLIKSFPKICLIRNLAVLLLSIIKNEINRYLWREKSSCFLHLCWQCLASQAAILMMTTLRLKTKWKPLSFMFPLKQEW